VAKAMTLLEFMEKFNDEDVCREYLFEKRFPDGFICPKCENNSYHKIKTRGLYQCKSCRHQVSCTAGTVLSKTHVKLVKWFLAMFLMVTDKRGSSATYLSKEIGVPYKTAWYLLHRLRSAMGQRDSKYVLSGIVDLDDTYFSGGPKSGKRGRGTGKNKVIAAISKDEKGKPKYLKMKVVPNLKGKTVGSFAAEAIAEKSHIYTDAYRSYRKPLAEKYNHDFEVFDKDSTTLRWLHKVIANAKALVNGTHHGLTGKHLQAYLDEFCYRFNRRHFSIDIFDRLALAAVQANPMTLAELR
jgi:transposase-like protein